MAYTHIDPGREIEISTRLYSSNDQDRVAELVKLPRTELGELEEASATLASSSSPNGRARRWGHRRTPVWHWRMRSSQNSLKSRPNG